MKTIDDRLIELCETAEDQTVQFRYMLQDEGPFLGLTIEQGIVWAEFEEDACCVQAILDLATMIKREPVKEAKE